MNSRSSEAGSGVWGVRRVCAEFRFTASSEFRT